MPGDGSPNTQGQVTQGQTAQGRSIALLVGCLRLLLVGTDVAGQKLHQGMLFKNS